MASKNFIVQNGIEVLGAELKADSATTANISSTPTTSTTVNISTGATASGQTSSVNLGTNGAAGSTTNIVIGSSGGNSNTTLHGTTNITGNLVVSGTTVSINSTNQTLKDPIITLGEGTASDDNKDRGIEFKYYDTITPKTGFFGWDDSTGKFILIQDGTNTNEVFTATTKGVLDVQRVDAVTFASTQATGTAPFTVASTTKVTNLNADLLDGFNSDASGNVNTIALRGATIGNLQTTGFSSSYGTTSGVNTGGVNVVQGVASSATWLISGTSGGVFRGGIQVLDAGGLTRFYTGAKYFLFTEGTDTLSATNIAGAGAGLTSIPVDQFSAGAISGANGGTGVINTGKTITIGGNFSTSGAFTTTLTATANTAITLPTTGTLATLAGSESLSNKTLVAPILGTPASGNFSTGSFTWPTFNQNTNGSAATLTTARTIAIGTGATGTATSFNGSANITIPITALDATYLTSGTVPNAAISGSYTGLTNLTGSGTVDFAKFHGDAADLVSTPSFSWTTDTTTGIYRPAASQVAVTIAGTQRVLITATGITATNLSGTNTGDNPGVTSVGNGNGMNFTTFSTTGTVTLGTPSTLTTTSTNAVTTSSHTHEITGFSPTAGNTSLTTLGTVATGTWNATTISTSRGGTGITSNPTVGGVMYGVSTSTYGTTLAGTSGYFLKSNGASAPTWALLEMTDIPNASYKAACRVATTANITLSGVQTVDGVVLVANDRVLVKNQTTSSQNGIYLVAAGAWSRSAGANTSAEINCAVVNIDLGTINAGSIWTNKFKSTDVLGTTSMPWYQVTDETTSVLYTGTTATAGKFDGGTTTPTGTTRLNYGGYFYPTRLNILGEADSAAVASHYYFETGSDGIVRPKTLANVRTEIVTTTAVNAASLTTTGIVTSGTWSAAIGTVTGTPSLPTGTTGVTQAPATNSSALATTAFVHSHDDAAKANLASPTFTGTVTAPTVNITDAASIGISNPTTANRFLGIHNTNIAGSAAVWINQTGANLQLIGSGTTNAGTYVAGKAGLYGTTTNGMYIWDSTATSIVFGLGLTGSSPTFIPLVANTTGVQMSSLGVGTPHSGTSGEIRATNNITAYYSDSRLKTVISKIVDPLEKVRSLSGVIYVGNDVAQSYGYTSEKEQVGVLAQEVQKVLPQVVVPAPFDITVDADGNECSKSGEGYLTVHYDKLVPLLIEAIKEVDSNNMALKAMINTQQEMINVLASRLDKITE